MPDKLRTRTGHAAGAAAPPRVKGIASSAVVRARHCELVAELVRLRRESAPESPSSFVHDLDAATESAILRCLDPDPAKRRLSTYATSAYFTPGGGFPTESSIGSRA